MKRILLSEKKKNLRKQRVKAKIFRGGVTRPRLCVSKTNKHIFLQIIDDLKGVTLASASDKEVKGPKGAPLGDKKRMEIAKELGGLIAKKALEKKVKQIVFDRNRFTYHGVVKMIAEGAREGGLEF